MTKLVKLVAIVVFLSVVLANTGISADEPKARLARVMWSAFQCSVFSEMSGNNEEQQRLFSVGLKAGREFIEAAIGGKITQEAMRREVPFGVTAHLGGPSVDFMVGRVYTGATKEAYDTIVKRGADGLPLKDMEWILDKDMQKMRASTEYQNSNCMLIR